MSIKHLVNSYQPRTESKELGDNLKVVYIENGFQVTYDKSKELLKLLDGALKANTVQHEGKPTIDFDLDFTAISSNFASGKMAAIEKFVRENCMIQLLDNGEWLNVDVKSADEFNFVFNRHADQYLNFLIDGVKFHFAKFLPSGQGLLKNLADKAMNKLQLETMKMNSV